MANLKGVHLHNSDEWATPWGLFEELDSEFNFSVDVCATDDNHKCKKYYTKETDGLIQNWGASEYSAIPHTHRLLSG